MRRRGFAAGVTASPTMVGALTVMVVILAVFLAYNANNGLPFVPSYRVTVDLPNANLLVPGNDVRVGGVRAGVVETIEPQQDEDGAVSARLDLKLNPELDPLPVDSTFIVRARSALGLKYLEINQGTSSEGYQQGSVIPITQAKPEPVEIDQVLNTFDEPTRIAIRQNLFEFGNAVAGRGPQLNEALGKLPAVLEFLQPVAHNLADPNTGLARFIRAIAATSAEVAPVAETQAELFVSLDTTFSALATVARPFIQETISESPPTLDAGTQAFPVIRPFLADSAELFDLLGPGVKTLAETAPPLSATLAKGTPVLEDSPTLNRQLAPTAESLLAFNNDTGVRNGLSRLTQTVDIFGPTVRFITPAQTVCNYGTLLVRNLSSVVAQGSLGGRWQRLTVFEPPVGPNNEGSYASAPANGGGDSDVDNFLHYNPYPNTASPGQTFECEAGNEPYKIGKQVIGNPPGNQGTQTDGQPGSDTEGSG
ncbi:MAG: phospholipid/cholesterol/gamma-HCH transport system substrate-binding protein [Solirubrobacterales bacterium]|jgi:virulence factor Mce-like protein|nr:phospholipid/cholesterol/gamma-HCH transport system substrate-binding protein [Solirubrobacterales bacterium]